MTLADLIAEFGAQADDRVAPYLWDVPRRIRFANQAVMEAVRRAKLIIDSTTPGICVIDYVPYATFVYLDPRVIQVLDATIQGQALDLTPIHVGDLIPGWRSNPPTLPIQFITDYNSNQLWFGAPAKDAGTVLLRVYREPLRDMVAEDDVPEMAARYHWLLVYWMKYLAMSDEDSEGYDPNAAERAARKFATEFGPPVSARNEKWVSESSHAFPDALA